MSQRPRRSIFFIANLILFITLLNISGCGPKFSYPADKVPDSVESICKTEYNIDVKAKVEGKTVGAVYYIDNILDDKGQIPKEVHEKMGQIMQVITRVALSSDLPSEFCVVIIRDRTSLNELVITRSVEDTRRAQSEAIGVEESINRTLFGQGKYQTSVEESRNFALKEIKLEDFLAEQISQRIRFGFAKETDKEDPANSALVLVDGNYNDQGVPKSFRFSVLSLKASEPSEIMIQVLKTVCDVLQGYKFSRYEKIEILDYVNRQKLEIPKEVVEAYALKKITAQEILDRYLTESQSIQEAFKLFGFNLVDSRDETNNPPIVNAAP